MGFSKGHARNPPSIRKPSRYSGGEVRPPSVAWDEARVRVLLAFPDVYEIGMSHLGILLLREILSARPGTLLRPRLRPVDRLRGASARRGAAACRRSNRGNPPGRSTSSGSPCATNSPIRTSSRCSTFPVSRSCRRTGRRSTHRGGRGVCTLNPAPVAPFFDALLVGDGEEAVLEIVALVEERKRTAGPRRISSRGSHDRWCVRPGISRGVKRRVLADLNRSPLLPAPILPAMRVVHDRLSVEISRGCTGVPLLPGGIRYRRCGSGILSSCCGTSRRRRPRRIRRGGAPVAVRRRLQLRRPARHRGDGALAHRAFALPPLASSGRVAGEYGLQIRKVRKSGFTLAPEAGTERLPPVGQQGDPDDDC